MLELGMDTGSMGYIEYRLDTAFEIWGGFFEPTCSQRVIHGKLSYAPEAGLELELSVNPDPHAWPFGPPSRSVKVFYGQLSDNTKVSLFGCFITNSTRNLTPGLVSPTTYLANRAIFGAYVTDYDSAMVQQFSVELSSLSNWSSMIPISRTPSRDEGKFIGFNISIQKSPSLIFDMKDHGISVKITYRFDQKPQSNGELLSWCGILSIVSHQRQPISVLESIMSRVLHLMSLLIGGKLSAKTIYFYFFRKDSAEFLKEEEIRRRAFELYTERGSQPGSADSDWGNAIKQLTLEQNLSRRPMKIVYHSIGKVDEKDIHESNMPLPYETIKAAFCHMLQVWLSQNPQQVLAVNVFFGFQNFDDLTIDVKFLAITQSVESYQRSSGNGKYMEQSKYDDIIRQFASLIPKEIKGDHRNSFKNRLKFGNEFSLRRRLKVMVTRLPPDLQESISRDIPSFIQTVVDTRNYLTHYDHNSRGNVLSGIALHRASDKLKILVISNLYLDLGVPDVGLKDILERNDKYKSWLAAD